ncbi:uncharacterized protein LOC109726774 [Ananas comosus]|uniref:Uncharacterized protein LOC109726774 n=1 Tax=Ananas comosus TaxID=4615 RepID=A0A6P5GU11_ANACO|nr:uncharacterized protein LOC109726774 [Ananas comosus]
MAGSNLLAKILDTNCLIRPNFIDWLRNLRIVLNSEKLAYVLNIEALAVPENITAQQRVARNKWTDDDMKVKCYMLLNNELESQYEHMESTADILLHLKELYDEQSRTTCYEVLKRLFRAKISDGQSINNHCLAMIKDIEELEKLRLTMDVELQTDLILQSLPDSFSQFTLNFQTNKITCTLAELLNMVTAKEMLKVNKGVSFGY